MRGGEWHQGQRKDDSRISKRAERRCRSVRLSIRPSIHTSIPPHFPADSHDLLDTTLELLSAHRDGDVWAEAEDFGDVSSAEVLGHRVSEAGDELGTRCPTVARLDEHDHTLVVPADLLPDRDRVEDLLLEVLFQNVVQLR